MKIKKFTGYFIDTVFSNYYLRFRYLRSPSGKLRYHETKIINIFLTNSGASNFLVFSVFNELIMYFSFPLSSVQKIIMIGKRAQQQLLDVF